MKQGSSQLSTLYRWTPALGCVLSLLVVFMLFRAMPLSPAKAQAPCTGTAMNGAAFRDYNANGTRDALEPGIAGIVVTAYDSVGGTVTCTTSADGSYGIDPTGAYPVRLEFTLPADGSLGFLRAGAAGSGSRTSVTFLSGATAGVNVGFNNPGDFCGANPAPDLISSCAVFGEQLDNPSGANKELPVLHKSPYTAGSANTTDKNAVSTPRPDVLARAKQLGGIMGLTWNPRTQTIYAAAFMKRHVGFGPNGPGAIYQIAADGTVSPFHNLGAAAGTDPHPLPTQTCFNPRDGRTDNSSCWLFDTNAFDQATKMSLGDLDISEDYKTLYTVNLADKTLVAIPIDTPAAATATAVPQPANCPATDVRPFGLGVQDGKVYLGMVCSGEATNNRNLLRAYVYSFSNGAFSAAPVLEFPLTYNRGGNMNWQAWLNRTTFKPADFPVNNATNNSAEVKWGQPTVSDISFDNGDMILGLRDRNGDLFGSVAGGPDSNDPKNYSAITRGDILRACANGSGGWTLESNGQCGAPLTKGGAGNNQGPGNGEYYFTDLHPKHNEISVGAQVQIPGLPEVVSLSLNPIDIATEVSDSGMKWYNNRTGLTTRGYLLFDGSGGRLQIFEKANGLGDIEALCPGAPLEIGNRVWNDVNANGVQDANENGIANVTLELYRAGVLVGTTTTDASGEYLFSDANVNLNGATGMTPGTCGTNGLTDYEVRIPNASGASQQAALAGLSLTQANTGGPINGEIRDSNGTLVGVNAVYAIPCGQISGPGDNNHTYDFGFTTLLATATSTATPTTTATPIDTATPTPTLTPTPAAVHSLGNYVWLDRNEDGKADAGEPPVPNGVTVELLDGAGNPTGRTTTTQNGFYLFAQLAAGDYRVRLPASNFQAGGLLVNHFSTTGPAQEANPNNNGDQNDNGLDVGRPENIGITSAVVTLGADEPTGEAPTATGTAGDDGQQTPDARSNLTVDFGLIVGQVTGTDELVAIGNMTFVDPNNNGRYEPSLGETGINNVSLQLFRNGQTTAISTTVTANGGFYFFDRLPPGQYAVCVAGSNFVPGQTLAGFGSSAGAGTTATTDQDGDENGRDTTNPIRDGVCSLVVALEIDTARVGENQSNYTGVLDDNNVNFTIDFGFLRTSGEEPVEEPQGSAGKIFIPLLRR